MIFFIFSTKTCAYVPWTDPRGKVFVFIYSRHSVQASGGSTMKTPAKAVNNGEIRNVDKISIIFFRGIRGLPSFRVIRNFLKEISMKPSRGFVGLSYPSLPVETEPRRHSRLPKYKGMQ